MATDDLLKDIQKLIRDELRMIKDQVEMTKKKVDSYEIFVYNTTENVRAIKEQQSIMNEKLDQHTEALVTIESKIDVYGDMYKLNKDNIVKLDKRINNVEDKLGIEPDEDLKVPHFSLK